MLDNKKACRRSADRLSTVLAVLSFSIGAAAQAGEPYVYPAKGQSADKMAVDKAECQAWATQQTGFDPLKSATAPAPSSSQGRRGGLLGGIRQHREQKSQQEAAAGQAQAQSGQKDDFFRAWGACLKGRGYSVN